MCWSFPFRPVKMCIWQEAGSKAELGLEPMASVIHRENTRWQLSCCTNAHSLRKMLNLCPQYMQITSGNLNTPVLRL